MDGKAIAETSEATAQSVRDALAWISDPRNAAKVSQERVAIEQKLRRVGNEAARLARSALRPTSVGVFGPSQAGKSYLISTLARKDNAPLIATFDGDRPEIDFVEDINPLGGDESTGVVTRFTIHKQPTPAGYPVCLKLLSQTDVVKILVNSYFQDGDQEYESPMDAQSLEALVAEAEGRVRPAVDTFTEADVWDIQEYVQRNSGGAATAAAIEPFWGRVAAVAPKLEPGDRATLLSVLWGRHEVYTSIYLKLLAALASLSFGQDAFVTTSALVPSSESVINVNALYGVLDETAARIPVSTATGSVVDLPRAVVTALIAELRIHCRDTPLPFFEHTDLLDFPGYRSREKRDLKKFFKQDIAPKEVLLRGKVDYLFQRYTSDFELTTMVLCIPDGPMEVATLPKAVETWVGLTHGATPEQRKTKTTLLYFALTKFDASLAVKAGDRKEQYPEKLQIRFSASMTPFSKVEPSWVKQWWPKKPFQNVFLLRNPSYQFKGVIEYSDKTEVRIYPTETERLADLRAAFVTLPTAIEHFTDPGAAWDALMTLNDGGAGRLAQALSAVCVADLKLGQIAARLEEIRSDVVETLIRYHVSEDLETRRAERLAIVDDKIFADLEVCAELGNFGSALRGLMIDGSDLYAFLVETLNRPGGDNGPDGPVLPDPKQRRIFGKKPEAASATQTRVDRSSRLADAALSCWASFLHARIEDPVFSRRIGISHACLRDIIAEIGGAARRLDLAKRISAELRLRAAPNEPPEAVARKATLVAERLVNRFVSELDFDKIDPQSQILRFADDLEEPVFAARDTAFDTSGIASERPDFTMGFMEQWGRAFRTTVSQNAMSKGGSIEDAAQNARLGKVLQGLSI